MTRQEYSDALDEIFWKRINGETLSRRDELLWAYRHVGRCHRATSE